MTIGIEHYLTLGALLFCIGFFIALSKKNAIGVLIGVELMLNAVNLTQVFVVFIIAVAAAEVAVGLALALVVYRNRQTISVDRTTLLRG